MIRSQGRIDMSMVSHEFCYLIVYSEPGEPHIVNTWVLPESSFKLNYKSMVNRGCTIHNVFKKMTPRELQGIVEKG